MNATSLATLWVFIALLAFVGIAIYLKVPALLTSALDARGAKIARELEEARRIREEAQALLASYQKKRIEAESEAADVIKLAKEEAASMVREAEKDLAEAIARKTKAVDVKIAAEMEAARADVRRVAIDVALVAAAKVLGERVQGEVAQQFLRDGIDEVGKRLN